MQLKICHLYPDILNLYGDQGNIRCLELRAQARGIEPVTTQIGLGDTGTLGEYDIVFIGGGQDFEQEVMLEDLARGKSKEIVSAVEDGSVFLAVCGGYQLLGQYYKTWDGQQYDFIGAMDLYTVGQPRRMVGNYMFTWEDGDSFSEIVGFENHSGKTYLGTGVQPLGHIISGYGNNGEDGTEGAKYKNVYGTYCHGPILPKNPVFADHLISTALSRKHPSFTLEQIDDTFETRAHDHMIQKLKQLSGKDSSGFEGIKVKGTGRAG